MRKALVRRAAAWFDKNTPGWHRKVRITELNLTSASTCITGQLREAGVRINTSTIPLYVQEATLWAGDGAEEKVIEPWKAEIRARRKGVKS